MSNFLHTSDIFIRNGLIEFSGLKISESFLDGQMISTQFMSYIVACMSYDECHMAGGGGYRVFLSQQLGVSANLCALLHKSTKKIFTP
jgi:hypothetical protein